MIEQACTIEDEQERTTLIKMIANHMKKAYVAWNQKSVTDAIIIADLEKLSHGKLSLSEDTKLVYVNASTKNQVIQNSSSQKKNNKNRNRNRNKKNKANRVN
jgi:hydroxyacyl-ACP dehydratase HTD2-like protein with hotdog domain